MNTYADQFRKVLQAANDQIIALAGRANDIDLAISLRQETIRILEEAGYDDVVAKFLDEESNIIKAEIAKYKGSEIPMKFAKSDVIQVEALQQKELLDLMNLKEGIAKKVQEITAQGIMTQMSKKELAKQIGKIKDVQIGYVNTYVETARNQYIQKLHDISAERYRNSTGNGVYWEYVGAPKDDLTRPECELALDKRYFTDAEKNDFQNGAMFDAKVPRWNCRHSFVEITEETYNASR